MIGALIRSLIRIDPVKAKELVLPLVNNPDLLVSRTAITTLGDRRAPWAFETLRKMLSDRRVADDAAYALLKINYVKAYPVIMQRVKSNKILPTQRLKESIVQASAPDGDADRRHRLMVLERELRGEKNAVKTRYALEINLRLNPGPPEYIRFIIKNSLGL